MSIQIKLKNSVVQDSTPSTSDLPEVGELAVNGNINSIGGFMRASDNTIVKIFGPGSVTTPTATTTVSGISELATNSETTTGTATNRVVTPAGLNAVTVAERTTSNTNYVAKAGSTMTGVLQLTAGSTSVPAINFGASNTGIYQASGANNVRIAVDGSDAISASTAGGVNFVPKATALTSLTLGSQSATDKPLFFADAASVESASLLLDNSSNEFRVRNNRFSGKIVFAPSSNVEKARIDNSGKLLVGTSTARTNFFNLASTHTPRFQIESTNDDNGRAALGLIYGKTNASGAYIVLAKHRSNTVGDNTVVQSGDETGIISFQGSDGSQFVDTARIESFVDGTPGSNDMPGRLVFSTTADGAASPTERLRIDSSGNVGIGTTSPRNISGYQGITLNNATHGGFIQFQDDGTNTSNVLGGSSSLNLSTQTSIPMVFNTADTERMRIDSSGRLLLGTTTEGVANASEFTIADTGHCGMTIRSGTSHDGQIAFSDGTSGDDEFRGQIRYNHGSNYLTFVTDATERMRIDSSGDVLFYGTIRNDNVSSALNISGGNGADSSANIILNGSSGSPANVTQFRTGTTERMRIASDGKVGIGDSTPNYELQVNDPSGTVSAIQITNTTTGAGAGDGFLIYNNGLNAILSNEEAGDLRLQTSGLQRLTIDSSGRLLLGASTSAIVGGGGASLYQIETTSQNAISCVAHRGTGNASGSIFILGKSRGTSAGAVTSVGINDELGSLRFAGADDTDLQSRGGEISCEVDGTPGSNDMPGRLLFKTTADGSAAPTERMRITSDAKFGFNLTPDASGGTVQMAPLHGYQSAATNLLTSASKAVLRVRTSSDSSMSLYVGAHNNTARPYLQVGNMSSADGGATAVYPLLLQPFGGNVGIGTSSPDTKLHLEASNNGVTAMTSANNRLRFTDTDTTVTTNQPTGVIEFESRDSGNEGIQAYIACKGSNTGQGSLHFATGKEASSTLAERVIIDQSGNVGIGTTSPSARLHVFRNNDNQTACFIQNNGTSGGHGLKIRSGGTGTGTNLLNIESHVTATAKTRLLLDASGRLRIGEDEVSSYTYRTKISSETGQTYVLFLAEKATGGQGLGIATRLDGAGSSSTAIRFFDGPGAASVSTVNVTATTVTYGTGSSDRTMKKNFENWTDSVLNSFKNLNPQKFNYLVEDDADEKHKGFVAQDLVADFPEAYPKDTETDKYSFNPSGMVVYLMKAIQELEAKVAALEAA